VLLTPFKRVVLPPPMYSTKLDCPANVASVSFAPQSYDIGVLLADNTVALWAPFDTTSQVDEAIVLSLSSCRFDSNQVVFT
jgi:hypothetical protein